MWFDVEEGYKTTDYCDNMNITWLWFDVEEGYKTTLFCIIFTYVALWFDVEEGYKTTLTDNYVCHIRCGLM